MGNIMESVQTGHVLLLAVLCPLFVSILYCFNNVFLHPLRKYPGPKFAAASHLWHLYHLNKGTLSAATTKLHEQYGLVVRISPNELSFIDARAWTDVYGLRVKPEMLKDDIAYAEVLGPSFIKMQTDDHRAVRRTLAHAFSEKALREQNAVLMQYLNLFVERLYDRAHEGKGAVDMVAWYNFFTFDVIGDLAFGEPFGCLENSSYHFWVSMIFTQLHYAAVNRTLNFIIGTSGPLRSFFNRFIPAKVAREVAAHQQLTLEKTDRRIRREDERPDFLEKLLKSKDKLPPQLSIPSMSNVLIIAGSETTATWLSGATYHLLKTPAVMDKVVNEVRSAFDKAEDITVLSTAHLKYMNAVLEESLRMYPPAPQVLPRRVPAPGAMVAGQWVSGGTTVGVPHYAAFRSPHNFTRPNDFVPERWLGDKEFANDKKDVFNPFSFGPRNCIGKNLAYAEGRLALASVLWHFDLKLDPESDDWTDQVVYTIWQKKPLKVHLTARFSV